MHVAQSRFSAGAPCIAGTIAALVTFPWVASRPASPADRCPSPLSLNSPDDAPGSSLCKTPSSRFYLFYNKSITLVPKSSLCHLGSVSDMRNVIEHISSGSLAVWSQDSFAP